MSIRPFEWRDLLVLHRYRHQGLFLDTASVLTRGSMLVPAGALLASFAPATGIFTYVCEGEEQAELPLVGQVVHSAGSSFARLSFLTPESAVESADLPALFDQIAIEIGERGGLYLLAEVNDDSPSIQALHRAGFAIYARQRLWYLASEPQGDAQDVPWKSCTSKDLITVRSLYNNLVPGLVQQIEPLQRDYPRGKVLYQNGEVLAYVQLRYGRYGIWAQPFVHPDVLNFEGYLSPLLRSLPNRHSRSIYLCIRSYQSWLEGGIEAMGAAPGALQAVMVRHLAVSRRAAHPYALPAINGTRPEPTAPIASIENDRAP